MTGKTMSAPMNQTLLVPPRPDDHRPRCARGFTLIEVMVVVVILSVLAAIVVPRIMDRPEQARRVKAEQDLRALVSALNLYRLDNFRYPTTDQGLQALVEEPQQAPQAKNWKSGGYLDRLPEDPWGQEYQYLAPGEQGDFDLYSLGPDAQLPDDDIGNWMLR